MIANRSRCKNELIAGKCRPVEEPVALLVQVCLLKQNVGRVLELRSNPVHYDNRRFLFARICSNGIKSGLVVPFVTALFRQISGYEHVFQVDHRCGQGFFKQTGRHMSREEVPNKSLY